MDSWYTELQVGLSQERSSISRMHVHCRSKLMGFNPHEIDDLFCDKISVDLFDVVIWKCSPRL